MDDRLIIAAFDVETPNSYTLTARGQKAEAVLEDF